MRRARAGSRTRSAHPTWDTQNWASRKIYKKRIKRKMKIRRFQEFNEDAATKAGEFKKKFSSPLYVSQDWEGFWEKQMRDKDPKEFNDKAEDLGWDFSEAYSNWEQDHDDDKFWEACNKII